MNKTKLYYFNKNRNFGDQLNPLILEKLFGLKIEWATPQNSQLVAIGSLMESYLHGSNNLKLFVKKTVYPRTVVWGSGFINEPDTVIVRPNNKHETFFKNIDVKALRGKYTKERTEAILNKKLEGIVLGDPGLLVSKLLPKKNYEKFYNVGIIPHYTDANNSLIHELNKNLSNVKLINILDEPLKILREIAECEVILSSAMHGLIAADSLSIPNARLIVSDNIAGGDYKFNDYYSAFDLTSHAKIDLRRSANINIDRILSEYPIRPDQVTRIQNDLIKSFPTI